MSAAVAEREAVIPAIFKRVEPANDGSVVVEGIASGPETDIDGQAMDPGWLRSALERWFKNFGNIREMHRPVAVGRATNLRWARDGNAILKARIIDRDAAKKVQERIYNGFSIGVKNPEIVPDPKAPRGKIVGGEIVEVSVVDYPAYPKAKFALSKLATATKKLEEAVKKMAGQNINDQLTDIAQRLRQLAEQTNGPEAQDRSQGGGGSLRQTAHGLSPAQVSEMLGVAGKPELQDRLAFAAIRMTGAVRPRVSRPTGYTSEALQKFASLGERVGQEDQASLAAEVIRDVCWKNKLRHC